jgi:hypothetical protein
VTVYATRDISLQVQASLTMYSTQGCLKQLSTFHRQNASGKNNPSTYAIAMNQSPDEQMQIDSEHDLNPLIPTPTTSSGLFISRGRGRTRSRSLGMSTIDDPTSFSMNSRRASSLSIRSSQPIVAEPEGNQSIMSKHANVEGIEGMQIGEPGPSRPRTSRVKREASEDPIDMLTPRVRKRTRASETFSGALNAPFNAIEHERQDHALFSAHQDTDPGLAESVTGQVSAVMVR